MTHRSNNSQWFMVFAVVFYIMLYEWQSIFERPEFRLAWPALKVCLPFIFMLYLMKAKQIFTDLVSKRYIILFLLFMIWIFIISFFSREMTESVIRCFKLAPVFIFCCFICVFMRNNETAMEKLMRVFVIISVLTVIQYIAMTISFYKGGAEVYYLPTFRGGAYRGPGGILGQGGGMVSWSALHISLFRLYGFWLEPAKTCGFMLPTAFFAEAIYIRTKRKIWRVFGIACFIASFCTFSNTAYAAIGGVGLLEEIYLVKTRRDKMLHIAKLIFFVFFIFVAIYGRQYVVNHYPDNMDLRYLIGVRGGLDDPYGGRIELLKSNLEDIKENPITGIGVRTSGIDESGQGYEVSASAPIYWLTFTGIIGLTILALRELQLISLIAKRVYSSVFILRISQAWLAQFIASLQYGALINPFYYVTVAMVFASIYDFKLKRDEGLNLTT